MSIIGSNVLAGASGSGVSAYEIEQSLRFDGSSHLNKALSTPTNAKKGTLSFWAKRSPSTGTHTVYQGNSNEIYTGFDNNGTGDDTYGIYLNNNSTKQVRVTTQLFRDPSAWYHIVIEVDTTQSSAADRLKLYVNGSEVTAFGTSNAVDQNDDVFPANTYRIGSYSGTTEYYEGYLAEFHYVDGTALDPTNFGEYDSNGVWRPIEYTGSYGTNGYYLKFDGTATNGIGHDHSGNGNNWTASGFVTSGTGTDVMSDTPTKNWCTLNPLDVEVPSGTLTIDNGNLDATSSSTGSWKSGAGTVGVSSGKWYWEATLTSENQNNQIGVINAFQEMSSLSNYFSAESDGWALQSNDNLYNGGSTGERISDQPVTGDVIGVALDVDNGKLWFSVNGSYQSLQSGQAAGNPSTGTNAIFTNLSGYTLKPAYALYNAGDETNFNFGQREFANPPGTIGATDYFNTVTYTANNQSSLSVTGVGFQPDLVWLKTRGRDEHHYLYDVVRGVGNRISTSQTIAEVTGDNTFTSFDSDGFTLGADGAGIANYQTDSMVAWCWKAGGSGSANNSGSLDATVSANNDAGFSVVTYTGNSTSGATFAHGLDTAPSVVIVKNIDSGSQGWMIYHSGMGETKAIQFTASGELTDTAYWNDTAPSSTLVTLGNDNATNATGDDFVAYCWAEKTGVSKFGEYTGNGSSDGPVISCGFRPAMVMIKWYKDVSTSESWQLYDNKRGGNPNNTVLAPDANADDESPTDRYIQFTADGFQLKSSGQQINRSGAEYIFMAWAATFNADADFKSLNTANLPEPEIKDGSEYFNTVLYTGDGTGSSQSVTGVGFQPDWLWLKGRDFTSAHKLIDSVRGVSKVLESDSNGAEGTSAISSFDSDGFTISGGSGYNNANPFVAWNWLAGGSTSSNTNGSIDSTVSVNATAGFSIVSYTGENAVRTVGHGLGVAPVMYMTKNRESSNDWAMYWEVLGANRLIHFNLASKNETDSGYWNDTAPTSTVFTVGTNTRTGGTTDDYIAYCFAEVEGFSKFSEYSANGNSDGPYVHCGFRPSVLIIKNYAGGSETNWVIKDTTRDTYNPSTKRLNPNSNAVESDDSNVDIDFLANGFKIRSTNTSVNESGSDYLFMAFAENPFGGDGVSPATAR